MKDIARSDKTTGVLMNETVLIVDDEREIADLVEVCLKMTAIRSGNFMTRPPPFPAWRPLRRTWPSWM